MAKKKSKKKKKVLNGGKARLNLLIDPVLKSWLHEYADRNQTTVTQLIIQHFMELKVADEAPRIRQI